MQMLDDRAELLLKALIERYIAEGQPVGSRTLSRASGLDLSPATIRNVMADLEELGLIASPHTSAGRVPTARGYRLFVDTMLTARREQLAHAPELPPDQPQKVIANGGQLQQPLPQGRTFQLLRLRIDPALGLVPEISGNRLIVSVRLMRQDNDRMVASTDNTPFELTLCA